MDGLFRLRNYHMWIWSGMISEPVRAPGVCLHLPDTMAPLGSTTGPEWSWEGVGCIYRCFSHPHWLRPISGPKDSWLRAIVSHVPDVHTSAGTASSDSYRITWPQFTVQRYFMPLFSCLHDLKNRPRFPPRHSSVTAQHSKAAEIQSKKSRKQRPNGRKIKGDSGHTHPPAAMSVLHTTLFTQYKLSHNCSLYVGASISILCRKRKFMLNLTWERSQIYEL